MQIIPMRELKNTVEIERRCAEENGPVFVTKNGYGRLVVMDIDYYDRTMKEMEEAKLIMEGLRDVEQGRTVDGETFMNRFWGCRPCQLSSFCAERSCFISRLSTKACTRVRSWPLCPAM